MILMLRGAVHALYAQSPIRRCLIHALYAFTWVVVPLFHMLLQICLRNIGFSEIGLLGPKLCSRSLASGVHNRRWLNGVAVT